MKSFAKFLMAASVGISVLGFAQDSELKTLVAGSKADVIYVHGNIYTGAPANTPFSSILREEAIAVLGDRIEAVGKNADIEKKFKGSQTKVVDLGGHFVMPGFNDAHLHLADAGVTAHTALLAIALEQLGIPTVMLGTPLGAGLDATPATP